MSQPLNYYYCCCCHHRHLSQAFFSFILLLNQWWSPMLRLQVLGCTTVRIVCDMPSTSVFCSESTECLPKFALNLCYYSSGPSYYWYNHTLHVSHSLYLSIHKLWYFSFFSAYFCLPFLPAGIVTSISIIIIIIILNLFPPLSYYMASSVKSRSQQEIKAIYHSTLWVMCAKVISVIFCSSMANSWPGSKWRFWSNTFFILSSSSSLLSPLCRVFTICATCNVILPMKFALYFYISTFHSICAVSNMAVVCSSLISRFPGMLLGYCLSDFEMVQVAHIIIGITLLSHSTCAEFLLWGLYIIKSSRFLFWSHFCPQELQYLLPCMFLVYYHRLWCPVYC